MFYFIYAHIKSNLEEIFSPKRKDLYIIEEKNTMLGYF